MNNICVDIIKLFTFCVLKEIKFHIVPFNVYSFLNLTWLIVCYSPHIVRLVLRFHTYFYSALQMKDTDSL